jgi:hypothetical protein
MSAVNTNGSVVVNPTGFSGTIPVYDGRHIVQLEFTDGILTNVM